MTDSLHPPATDLQARREALDPERSFIVQAPAGSGKTELLTQRLLALLAEVNEPEEILAITFTRKAAAEMRGRLLMALQSAHMESAPHNSHARTTWLLAKAALRRSDERGWDLLGNPLRLQLQTIDSFCSLLTRRMPWLSRFGAPPRISQEPLELYGLAAEQLLGRLESGEAGGESVALLLDHLDNQLSRLRDMIVVMLGRRDQWLRSLLDRRHEQARVQLEEGLRAFNIQLLRQLHTLLGADPKAELLHWAESAACSLADSGDTTLQNLLDVREDSPEQDFLLWDRVLQLALTNQDQWRKSVDRRQGFPPGAAGAEAKRSFLAFLKEMSVVPGLLEAMQAFRRRPASSYQESQWELLDALIELLPLAVAELSMVFRQQGEVDFIEVASAALLALGNADAPEELLLQLDARLRHILVDEFQDTSYIQYELLHRLTSGWEAGDGRTLFLVGDPMPSIYRFRQAEVGYFLRVCTAGIGQVRPVPIRLEANFRSRQGVVDWVNDVFPATFPPREDLLRGGVPYAVAAATRPALQGPAVDGWACIGRQDEAEAARVVELVEIARKRNPDASIAILVRARRHFACIIPALRRAGLAFQAQDLDSLEQRPLIQDLRALTRALLHPADRISWLAVLRSPWCGLTLHDLQQLIGGERRTPIWDLLDPRQREMLFSRLSEEGQKRWERIRPALEAGLETRGRCSLRALVETTWLAMAGPACVDAQRLPDAERYFRLLEELDHGGDLLDFEQLDRRLEQLFASPDPLAGDRLQLMTIHKAKGLQFDTVILPGLGRTMPRQERPLLNWLEHPEHGLLLAPMRRADSDTEDPTYQAIQRLQQEKGDLETDRLLYVAVTRAVERVHLLGHLETRQSGDVQPAVQSLLARIWGRAGGIFTIRDVPMTEEKSRPPQVLKRLPAEWQIPPLAPTVKTRREGVHSASKGREGQARRLAVNLRSHENRVTGNLIHHLLETFGQPGGGLPTRSSLRGDLGDWQKLLVHGGIPAHRLDACLQRVQTALEHSFFGRNAEFLFTRQIETATEFAIHGMLDGQLVHAVIDRTFISDDGVRWILDYKTSEPKPGEMVEDFLLREQERYAPQLQIYSRLLTGREPLRKIRSALYFPLIDRLVILES